jgi:hypothetical protein
MAFAPIAVIMNLCEVDQAGFVESAVKSPFGMVILRGKRGWFSPIWGASEHMGRRGRDEGPVY